MRALLVPPRVCTRTLHLPRLVWNVFMRASCATLHHASRPFSPSSIVSNYRHKKKKTKARPVPGHATWSPPLIRDMRAPTPQ